MSDLYKSFRNETEAYVLHMLGAPLVRIELDGDQLGLCLDRVADLMRSVPNSWLDATRKLVYQEGVLAHAKIMLGRVRSKYRVSSKGVNCCEADDGTNSPVLDGEALLTEGHNEYKAWRELVFGL